MGVGFCRRLGQGGVRLLCALSAMGCVLVGASTAPAKKKTG